MAQSPEFRFGELSRGVLVLLEEAPDGLTDRDVLEQLKASVPPTPSELLDSATSVGVSRYEESTRVATRELVKARWLTTTGGIWRVTDNGRAALVALPDPVAFYRAAVRRRNPSVTVPPPSDVGDPFAGCFLSIAGSLVGAVIGTAVLVVRMVPNLGPAAFLGGFGAALVAGVVVGLVAMFPFAGVAMRVGRGQSGRENIWLIGTAVAAAIAAALTPSLLFAGRD